MSAAEENVVPRIGIRTNAFSAPPDELDAQIEAIRETAKARLRLLRALLGLQAASLVGVIILAFRT